MNKSYQTAIVIIPPAEIQEPIQSIRSQFDSRFRRWMPHITLLYPFVPIEKLNEAVTLLKQHTWKQEPFQVTLNEIKYFRHKHHYTIWFEPIPAGPLIQLVRELNQIFPEYNDTSRYRKGFTPHLSLGQAKNKEELKIRMELIREQLSPVSFIVDAVHVIYRNNPPDDIFREYASIPFE